MPLSWRAYELDLVRDNLDADPALLARKMNTEFGISRTPKAVYQMQRRMKNGTEPGVGHTVNSEDFDLRPSGWYEETISVFLLEFPDVMETWAHYHRYVEVKYVSTMREGLVTLNCRRDADAP